MSKPIKILHVFSRLVRGGAEVRTLEILRHLDPQQYQFHFCALSGCPGELDDEARRLGAQVHLMRLGQIGFPRRFRALLREQNYDVVHSHLLNYTGHLLRMASQSAIPKRVAFFRSSHDGRRDGLVRNAYRRLMRHWINRYATTIEAVSEGAMEAVWGSVWKDDPRCQIIYDGIDPEPFAGPRQSAEVKREFGVPPDGPLYIHVGRIAPPKNHLRLIEIFAEVTGEKPDARLLIAGSGDSAIEQRARNRAAELEVDDRAIFCGERADVPRLMKAADALLFPSHWEGLPGAVLEACAAGTPTLASDLPGVREIADRLPGVHYLPLESSNAQWVAKLDEIVQQTERESLEETMRQAFLESVFTIDRCSENHCRVWERD